MNCSLSFESDIDSDADTMELVNITYRLYSVICKLTWQVDRKDQGFMSQNVMIYPVKMKTKNTITFQIKMFLWIFFFLI